MSADVQHETHQAPRRRPRLLLVAFMCSPDHGSEWAIGWNRVIECAKHFETWVICQGDQQESEVNRWLETHGPMPNLHFEFISYRGGKDYPSHVKRLQWITYRQWHRRAYRAAQRLHQEHQFDLVHQVTNTGFREPGYLWKLDAPFVWGPVGGMHNYPWRFLPEAGFPHCLGEALRSFTNSLQLYWSRRNRRAARRSSALLIANSTGQAQFKKAFGIRPQVIADVGVTTLPAPHDRSGRSGPLRILWSGQLVARKALSLLLMALAEMPADVPYELRVVGGGPLERRWKRLANRLGVDKHITWLGWVPHKESLAQYAWADIFAFTSLRDTMGTVNFEALAHGLPVVCLDHQGVHDSVTDACGIKVPVTTRRQAIDGFRRAITRLAVDADLRAAMSRAASLRAHDYLWPNLGDQMTEVYRRVLGLDVAPESEAAPQTVSAPAAHVNGSHGVAEPVASQNRRSGLRSRIRKTADWGAGRTAAGLHAVLGDRSDDGFGILMYHRVTDRPAGVDAPTHNVTPRRMREQLAGLLARGFEAWPLGRLLEAHRANRPIGPKVFAVTFDDGYENNFLEALPILRELRVPATIFLATASLDNPQPFVSDNWSCAGSPRVPAGSWRMLSTVQCRELLASGLVALGAHTHTHQNFVGRADAFRRDLTTCVGVLRERFGIERPTFAFPFGATSPELVEAAREMGVACALTTQAERVSSNHDPFAWGRFDVDQADTAATLAAKLGGWYTPVVGALRGVARTVSAIGPGTRGNGHTNGHAAPATGGNGHSKTAIHEEALGGQPAGRAS